MPSTLDLCGILRGQTPKAFLFQITGPQQPGVPEAALSRRFWFPKYLTRLTMRGRWHTLEVPQKLLKEKLEERAAPVQRRLWGEDAA